MLVSYIIAFPVGIISAIKRHSLFDDLGMMFALLGPSLVNVMFAIGIVNWVTYARLIRGEILSLKEKEFISAVRALGATTPRIVVKHLLPNALAPVIVMATLGMAGAIITESSLSFLGIGVQPPTPSWGQMLSEGREIIRQAWWVSTFPGVAIMIVVLAFNVLGDSLRDAMDPNLVE